jgi:protein tyrosine phosphatase (PTP) superfamily phosphohydrolase (DUF442 family)
MISARTQRAPGVEKVVVDSERGQFQISEGIPVLGNAQRQEEPMADPETIYNWCRLDDRITTSGQPTEEQLGEIHALGVRHIVNLGLHTHEKALPDESGSVSRLGMEYTHIPVDFQNPTEQDFQQFCAVMEQLKDIPVHVHCIANARVSAFYRYRRDVLGMDEAQARGEMEAVWRPNAVWAAFIAPRGESRDR